MVRGNRRSTRYFGGDCRSDYFGRYGLPFGTSDCGGLLGNGAKSMRRRLYICIPMFVVAIGLLLYSLRDANGFNMIWRYFAWANQTLAVFTLWAITVFLTVSKKPYIITLIPALFMTCVCSTYICIAPEGLGLSHTVSYGIGIVCVVVAAVWFYIWMNKQKTRKLSE